MTLFLDLPLELLERIITLSSAQGAARLSQCCKRLHIIIQKNAHIWRSLYLEHWDDPRTPDTDKYNWKGELQENVSAWNIIRALQAIEPPFNVPRLLQEMSDDAYRRCASILLRSRGPCTTSPRDIPVSRSLIWLKRVVGEHAVYVWPWIMRDEVFESYPCPNDGATVVPERETPEGPSDGGPTVYLTKLSDRWRLMHQVGHPPPPMAHWLQNPTTPLSYALRTRNAARCFVYDMRKYKQETRWGPWTTAVHDGGNVHRVNWEHVFCLLIVTLANLEEFTPRRTLNNLRAPSSYEYTAPYSAPGWNDRSPDDWAGVEGTWRRAVSFMDYRELVQYNVNFSVLHESQGTLDDSIFRDPGFGEEFRVLNMTLAIESIDDPSISGSVDPIRPTIRFTGISRGGAPNESTVRGSVSVMESGEIRWHLVDVYREVSTFDREDCWQSEGMQIGGLGSAFGVIGCWSPYEHESVRDPAGPFWMWKLASEA